jgi:hypothetical protein
VSGLRVILAPVPLEDGESVLVVTALDETVGTCVMTKNAEAYVQVVCDGADLLVTLDDDIFTVGDGTLLGIGILGEFGAAVDVSIRLQTPTQTLAGAVDIAIQQSGDADCGPACRGGAANLALEVEAL